MVYKCCVYRCKSNCAFRTKAPKESATKVPHVSIFRFPNDKVLRAEWVRRIPDDGGNINEEDSGSNNKQSDSDNGRKVGNSDNDDGTEDVLVNQDECDNSNSDGRQHPSKQ